LTLRISRPHKSGMPPCPGNIGLVPARAGERQRRFLETPFWDGLPGGPEAANGEVEGSAFFLCCLGFFFSRLLFCWPLATGRSFKGGRELARGHRWAASSVIFA
jgi:hypothetical protein